jgi:hypothetical protein
LREKDNTAKESAEANLDALSTAVSTTGFSRDEMNLAEFPLAVLSTRSDPAVKTLEFSDVQRTRDGEVLDRRWIITGADKFGLPTSTDDDVILGLIRLTVDDGFQNPKVYFSRYELLKILRWTTEGRSYSRLTKSLDRLSGVRIRASNAFYDNSSKTYQTKNFGIIDAYEISGKKGKGIGKTPGKNEQSYFIWSEQIFNSFKSGFVKKLDLDYYFTLKSAVSRRLYRYLDKHFYFRNVLEKQLLSLAFEKLGLSRNYKFVSSIKQQLEPALEELQSHGFLDRFEYVGKGDGTLIRLYAKSTSKPRSLDPRQESRRESNHESRHESHHESPIGGNGSAESGTGAKLRPPRQQPRHLEIPSTSPEAQRSALIEGLVTRGFSFAQAKRLMEAINSPDELRHVDDIIRYYDFLVERNDVKISRNKVGFLYRAVEKPGAFHVPEKFRSAQSARTTERDSSKRPELKVVRADTQASIAESQMDTAYHAFIDTEIAKAADKLGMPEIESVTAAVEKKMQLLRSVLSEERFKAAVATCVRDELAKRLKLPDRRSWEQGARH